MESRYNFGGYLENNPISVEPHGIVVSVEPSATDIATVVAAAHHASGHVVNAQTSQSELASRSAKIAGPAIDLSLEFNCHIPEAIKSAVEGLLPDATPTPEATLLRLQAEESRSTDSTLVNAPKISFKQKYVEEPGRTLNAEAAYEMFHNIFYVRTPSFPSAASISFQGIHKPEGIEDYGTSICSQEIHHLSEAAVTLAGRTILVLVLNQFRSKKVF